MASDRQAPVPRMVAPDETRPVDVSGANSRPLPRRPPPPRNPQPPPASRISTRERLEAAASRFMDDLPDGVGIPDDDDADFDDGPTDPLDIELELDGPAASEFDEAATKSYAPAVDGQAQIESVLGIPSDDDSAMFRIKAGATGQASSVISSAAPPARPEAQPAAGPRPPARPAQEASPVVTGKTMAPGAPSRDAGPVVTGRTMVPGPVQAGPAVTGKTVVPGSAQAPRRGPAPPSMSSLGMRKPADTQEIDLDDIETTDEAMGAAASGVEAVPDRAPVSPEPSAPTRSDAPHDAATPAARAVEAKPATVPAAAAAPRSAAEPTSTSTPAPTPTSHRPPSADVVVAEARPSTPIGHAPAPRRGRAGLWVALVGVLLIAGGGVGAWQAGVLDPWLGQTGAPGVAAADPEPPPGELAESSTPTAVTDPATAAPMSDGPHAADPAETDPAEADPAEADPAEADPAEADPAEADPAEADPTETDPAEDDPSAVAPPAIPAGPASLEAARGAIASDPAKAYALAEKVNDGETSDAALEIMATAGCAADDGKAARKAFRSLGDAEARRRVTDYCLEKTEINILAKTGDYTGDEHLRRARRQYEAGEHGAALDSIKSSQKIKRTPEAGELQVTVYCAQDNLKKARYMLRRMRPSSREAATKACEDMGLDIGEL